MRKVLMSDRCAICGSLKEDHHEFVADVKYTYPEGCVCYMSEEWDPGDGENLPEICDNYVECEDGVCINCSHEEGCHKNER